MKFGGTSVADAEAMNRVAGIVRGQIARNPGDAMPVVVVSAMSKVTDRLIECGRLAGEGDAAGPQSSFRISWTVTSPSRPRSWRARRRQASWPSCAAISQNSRAR